VKERNINKRERTYARLLYQKGREGREREDAETGTRKNKEEIEKQKVLILEVPTKKTRKVKGRKGKMKREGI